MEYEILLVLHTVKQIINKLNKSVTELLECEVPFSVPMCVRYNAIFLIHINKIPFIKYFALKKQIWQQRYNMLWFNI